MPVTIPPDESRTIVVSVRLPQQVGLYTRKSVLVVEDEGMRSVGFRITGRVRPAASE